MLICTSCGQQNADDATRCAKCGVALGHQVRAKLDLARARNGKIIRGAIWLVVLVVLVMIGPSIYRKATGAYLQFQLNKATENTMIDCGGPVTDSMQQYERDKIDKCVSKSEALKKAQADYDEFLKGDK